MRYLSSEQNRVVSYVWERSGKLSDFFKTQITFLPLLYKVRTNANRYISFSCSRTRTNIKSVKTNYGWFRLFNFQFTLQVNDSRILPVNEQLSIIKWFLSHLILMLKCIDRAPSPNTFVHSILFRRLSHTCRFSLAVHVHNFIQNQSLATVRERLWPAIANLAMFRTTCQDTQRSSN